MGMAPNQQPTRFISPTDLATSTVPTRRSGNRLPDNAHTATTEFSVVSGICGSAATGVARTKSASLGGSHAGIDHPSASAPRAPASFHNAIPTPPANSTSPAGIMRERSSKATTAIAPPTTTQPVGPLAHPASAIRAPFSASVIPRVSCTPRTTARGTTRSTIPITPNQPSPSTITPTTAPAAAISCADSPCAIAIAAIAFMGWIAIGIRNINPVMIVNTPAKNRLVEKSSPFPTLIATSNGRNVPRSPREPAISARDNRANLRFLASRRPTAAAHPAPAPTHRLDPPHPVDCPRLPESPVTPASPVSEVLPMRSLGLWLIVLAVASYVLPRFGMQLVILVWIHNWGPGVAWAIQGTMLAVGIALLVAGSLRVRVRRSSRATPP